MLSDKNRYKGGRPKKVYLKITPETLAEHFNVKEQTIKNWIYSGILDASSLQSIIDLSIKRNKQGELSILKEQIRQISLILDKHK